MAVHFLCLLVDDDYEQSACPRLMERCAVLSAEWQGAGRERDEPDRSSRICQHLRVPQTRENRGKGDRIEKSPFLVETA